MTPVGHAPGTPSEAVLAAVESELDQKVITWRKPHTGLSPAQRFVVTLKDGSSVFVKAAVDDETERWLRNDHLVMATLPRFVPEIVAWTNAAGRPVLIMEDLSDAHWPADHFRTESGARKPVRWKPGQLELLFDTLDALATSPVPEPLDGLDPLHGVYAPQWPSIAEDPARFVDLGFAEEGWLLRVVDDLASAEQALDLSGTALVHNDVRSDNVCFRGETTILVDWSDARRGASGFDLANLLQGLPLEGGPDPFDVLPTAGSFAAWRAGELINRVASQAESAPEWLVRVFKRFALIDLDWAVRCLDLPDRRGPDWRAI